MKTNNPNLSLPKSSDTTQQYYSPLRHSLAQLCGLQKVSKIVVKFQLMQISKPFVQSSLLLLVSFFIASIYLKTPQISKQNTATIMDQQPVEITEIFGVKIEKNPAQSKLDQLQVTSWPKYSMQPSTIPWSFEATETMYLLEGKVKVSVDGQEGSFEIGGRDLVVFPKGMKITWEVLEAVSKHYSLEK